MKLLPPHQRFSLADTPLFLYCNLAKVINRLLPIWRNTSLASTTPRGDDDDAPQQSMCLYMALAWVHLMQLSALSRARGSLSEKSHYSQCARHDRLFLHVKSFVLGSFNVDFLMMRIEWNSRNVFTGLATNNEREHTHMNYASGISTKQHEFQLSIRWPTFKYYWTTCNPEYLCCVFLKCYAHWKLYNCALLLKKSDNNITNELNFI
jgi:hypothetical protein